MVQRRDLMGGGLVAGLATLMTPPAEAANVGADDEAAAVAINRLREAFERQFDQVYSAKWRGVSRVRQQQRTWMLATRKYPDFIEIGVGVWESLYDWHVRYQQPLNVQRTADGRYVMAFMFTTLILRPDQAPDYLGPPFDNSSDRLPQTVR